MINWKDKTVLALSPHTDDIELGCGGTLAKCLEEGAKVYCCVFSTCEESVPDGFEKDILEKEFHKSMEALGVSQENLTVLHFPVRFFESHRQEVLEELVKLNREINPDVVFCPSVHDVHQDHLTVANECLRAFKRKTILMYEDPWNNFTFDFVAFSRLEKRHIDKKLSALQCYRSQKGREYISREYQESAPRMHGILLQCDFAEVFECPRIIL